VKKRPECGWTPKTGKKSVEVIASSIRSDSSPARRLAGRARIAARCSNTVFCARQSRKFAAVT
jgi:hypothetical protein